MDWQIVNHYNKKEWANWAPWFHQKTLVFKQGDLKFNAVSLNEDMLHKQPQMSAYKWKIFESKCKKERKSY